MFTGHDHLLAELRNAGLPVSAETLHEAQLAAHAEGKSLATVLLERGHVRTADLLQALARHLGATCQEKLPSAFPAELLARVTPSVARRYQILPLAEMDGRLAIVAVDPWRPGLVEELSFALGQEIELVVADPREVRAHWARFYPEDNDAVPGKVDSVPGSAELSVAAIEELAGQAPVVRLVNTLLTQAIRDQASDIHFEPFESEFRIRCRIDGAMHDFPSPPPALALPVISRLKVLANLNIAERRLPQDGRIKLQHGGRAVDLRVSTLPTQHGESVVLRVLDQSSVLLDLHQLGLPAQMRNQLEAVIRRPNGILVVTGPTGSGKTTTLYSCLKQLNEPGVKLLTIEDPVEYEIDGIMQVPVNPGAGLTFATALRSFLRQDPDIVMVGEIRDLETAQIAIQASLTGHLVLTTLHTNDAASTVTRLIDMGIEPYLLASSLEAVVAQRLVRRLCPACKQAYAPDPIDRQRLGAEVIGGSGRWYRAVGCRECHHTGYKGRRGIFEFLPLTEHHREGIVRGVAVQELRRQTQADGMTTLREAGLAALAEGETTVEEISQAT